MFEESTAGCARNNKHLPLALPVQVWNPNWKKYTLSSTCSARICLCTKIFSVHSALKDDCAKNFSICLVQMNGCAENFAACCVQIGTTCPNKSTKWSNKPEVWTKWQKLAKNVKISRKVYKKVKKVIQPASKRSTKYFSFKRAQHISMGRCSA